MTLRHTSHADIPALQAVLDKTELFPSDMLPEMIEPFLTGATQDDIWMTALRDDTVCGFCFARAEALTDGTWNMLAIAVLPQLQGRGIGREITAGLEAVLCTRQARVLIADTSGTDAFAQTRAFYQKQGYAEEARIRDFWEAGDDKVVFWKSLTEK